MVQRVIGILLIVFVLAMYILVGKKERYHSDRFEVTIFNRWQIPSALIIIVILIISCIGITLILY